MYKIPANTLFLGKNLVFVPECHSTNTLALQLSQKSSIAEGTLVITNNQTGGRGQRNSKWEAEPGKNLTFSIIFKPQFLPLKDQFYLTIIISLALRDYLAATITQDILIKWPNDILVCDKKICGILIENQVQGSQFTVSVIGIGLNVNQTSFGFNSATSIKLITTTNTDLPSALEKLLPFIEARYFQLRQQKYKILYQEYLSYLYWRNEKHTFSCQGDQFEGTINGIDENGRLQILTSLGIKFFGAKEIVFEN